MPEFSWKVLQNPHGSDHFPVMLERKPPALSLLVRTPRWKLDKADSVLFQSQAVFDMNKIGSSTPDESNRYVADTILKAAHFWIPPTSGKLPLRCRPWSNENCAAARKRQNQVWAIFRRYSTYTNLVAFKRRSSQAGWTRKQAKRASWRTYISSLNSIVTGEEVWDKLHAVSGEYRSFTIPSIFSVSSTSASVTEQVNILGERSFWASI